MGTDDPRDETRIRPPTYPKTWGMQGSDGLAATSMALSGAVMLTRNRFFAWPALFVALSAFVNQQPLRTKEGGSAFSSLGFALVALLAGYMPMFIVPRSSPGQTPLPL